RTSSSGTCSASTTSRASRTGRSCRPTPSRSGSSRSASSTGIRHWTRRAPRTIASPRPATRAITTDGSVQLLAELQPALLELQELGLERADRAHLLAEADVVRLVVLRERRAVAVDL